MEFWSFVYESAGDVVEQALRRPDSWNSSGIDDVLKGHQISICHLHGYILAHHLRRTASFTKTTFLEYLVDTIPVGIVLSRPE